MVREERDGATEDREAAIGRPQGPKEAAQPKKMTVEQTPEAPTSWSDQIRPREVGGQVAPPPGRLA